MVGSSTKQASAATRKTADLRIIRASMWLSPIGEPGRGRWRCEPAKMSGAAAIDVDLYKN
jgi:hypothetical protein